MFTGLIEEVGAVRDRRVQGGVTRLTIAAALAADARPGDSVAVCGVCLTVERVDPSAGTFTVAAVDETLRRTTAGTWRRGTRVHLERAVRAQDRLGGHLVQGHADGVARVLRAGREGREFVLTLAIPEALRRYVVAKGALAVDGISLTVGAMRGGVCRLYVIPETLSRTLAADYRPGAQVNIEVDLVAKYVESLFGRTATGATGTTRATGRKSHGG